MRNKVFSGRSNRLGLEYTFEESQKCFELGARADYLPLEQKPLDRRAYNLGLDIHQINLELEEYRRILVRNLHFLCVYDHKTTSRQLKETSRLIEKLKEIKSEKPFTQPALKIIIPAIETPYRELLCEHQKNVRKKLKK